MNCCQPHVAPHASGKRWLLICSVKALATFGLPFQSPDSVTVAGVTVSKLPIAEEMFGPDTTAEMSLLLPTMLGRGPAADGFGNLDGGPHGTSCHSRLG